ncbi:hypothetical protein SERLA73DRAFT_149270 [Serpula lacrymans var. lacrymans S7.3]|uniref:Uncharacterized protein n=1 Tax=Serpula lacrymans var. lacrymans (strain S7.3) TaxID=936435 RepID=F8PHC1_SERL3|nr:hypothetical protein SERLA73DRAFT_149270 [Serpula lacrymans var. lacrymans S7.3]
MKPLQACCDDVYKLLSACQIGYWHQGLLEILFVLLNEFVLMWFGFDVITDWNHKPGLVHLCTRRKQFIEKIGWRMNKKGNLYFSLWDVEILYVNYCGKFDINKVFLNPLLKVVISCIVRGPGSIFSTKERTPYDGAQSTETLDVKWGLQHTTPGMIASAAVLYLQSGLIKTKASVLTIFYDEDWSEEMQEVMGALNKDTEELPLDNEERDDRGPGDDGINGEDVPGWQYGDNNIEFGLGGSQKEGKV